jgi:hypothetical protein
MPASRPLHAVFLERVIRIEAVQRERAQVTEEYAAGFFDAGRLLGELDDFCWSLDEPELFSRRGTVQILGVISPRGDFIPDPSRERTVSPAMQRAWEAAVAAWRTSFVAPLRNGQLIANARYPATGERHDLDRAEWLRTGLRLDVHDGTLFTKDRDGKPAERWEAITLREAVEPQAKPQAKPRRKGSREQDLIKQFADENWPDGWELVPTGVIMKAADKDEEFKKKVGLPFPSRTTFERALGRRKD